MRCTHLPASSRNIIDKSAMVADADLDGEEQVFPKRGPACRIGAVVGVARFPSAGDVDKILIDEKSCNSDEDAGLRMHGPEFVTLRPHP